MDKIPNTLNASVGREIVDIIVNDNFDQVSNIPSFELIAQPQVHIGFTAMNPAGQVIEDGNLDVDKRINMASTVKVLFVEAALGVLKTGEGLDLELTLEDQTMTLEEIIDDLLNESNDRGLFFLKPFIAERISTTTNGMSSEDFVENLAHNLILDELSIPIEDRDEWIADPKNGINIFKSSRAQTDPNSARFGDLLALQKVLFGQISKGAHEYNPIYSKIYQALTTAPTDEIASENNRLHEVKYLIDSDVRKELGIANILGKSGLAITGISSTVQKMQLEGMEVRDTIQMPVDGKEWYNAFYHQEIKGKDDPTYVLYYINDTVQIELENGNTIVFAYDVSVPANIDIFDVTDPQLLAELYGLESLPDSSFDADTAFQKLHRDRQEVILTVLEHRFANKLMQSVSPQISKFVEELVGSYNN